MARTNLVVALAVVALAGCHRPVQPTELTAQRVLVADEPGEDRLWEAAQEVLRRHRFPLDRVDRRRGMIATMPVTSQSFFEFWRHDVDTAFDLAEALLRTVRRSAVVQLDRHPESGEATVTVTVRRETFATPERQFNSSAASLRVFGDELPGVQGERLLTREDDYWIDDGRDEAMERRLLERIMQRALVPRATQAVAY